MLIERFDEVLRHHLFVHHFDMAPLEHVDELAVFEERDGWRRRRDPRHMVARPLGGLAVDAGEDRLQMIGDDAVLEGTGDARPGGSCGAATD